MHICIYVCVCVYIYIYIYVYEHHRLRPAVHAPQEGEEVLAGADKTHIYKYIYVHIYQWPS